MRHLLGCINAVKPYFRLLRGNSGLLSRHWRGKEPLLALRGESPGLDGDAAGSLGLFSNYDRDLREPLVLPREVKSPLAL